MPKQARNGSKAIKVLGQGQEVKKTNVSEKDKILKHFKKQGGRNINQALKCFKNAQTGKERKQGNKSIGAGSRSEKNERKRKRQDIETF